MIMKQKISSGRLNYEPSFGYREGVLLGPDWYEERLHYVTEIHKHNTIYNDSFEEKEPSFVHPNTYWHNRIQGEGVDNALLMCHDKEHYYDNFATTNDLVYKWLPQCKQKKRKYNTIRLTYVPEQDLALGYGNVTSYGLKELKKLTWDYQKLTEPSSWTTENKDNYTKPKPQHYETKRIAIPWEISSKRIRPREIRVTRDFPIDVKERPYPHFYY